MSLYDLLACPRCKAAVARSGGDVVCARCAHRYPVVGGVPIMLRDPARATLRHDLDLPVRPGYSRWKERLILKSLTDTQIALDFGAGNQGLDDPCIVRMDLVHGPNVDLVGDVQELPFRDGCLDFVFGGAVMEHVARPHVAIDELFRTLKPGGYVYADWNFLIAYHGYPHHYFNASIHGVRQAFSCFTILDSGIGPGHGAAWAFRSFLQTYLLYFQPQTRLEREFADRLREVLLYPLDDFDDRLPADERFRVAVSGYVVAVKQPAGGETIVPPVVVEAWQAAPELQRRYPQPFDLSQPDNVMRWAKEALGFDVGAAGRRWSKRGLDAPWDRATVAGWPWELMDRVDLPPVGEAHRWALWFSRPIAGRLAESWEEAGATGLARCAWRSLKRTAQELRQRSRKTAS